MSGTARLPAHLEIAGLIRLAQEKGGMATVLSKGERDGGTILLVTMHRGENARLFERMPQLDGSRKFIETRTQHYDNQREFVEYLERRARQDPDIWVLEVDIPDAERFIAVLGD